jgi:hypothetical protein
VASEFDKRTSAFVKEMFQIAEWALVVSALVVAGKKLDIPIAVASGYAFWALLCFYLGVRVSALLAFARRNSGPEQFSYQNLIIAVVASCTFGLGLGKLIEALVRAAG